jgi:hypothetical protein
VAQPGGANELHEIVAKTTSPKWDSNPRPKVYETFSVSLFERWLESQNKRECTIREIMIYAKRFNSVLLNGDASTLLALSPRNRHHAMTALANLAKYQGQYDRWLQIRQRYSLKWSNGGNSIQSFERFFNPQMSLDHMIDRVRKMMQALPRPMSEIVRFACLTGLRPAEACESVRLLNDKGVSIDTPLYYNPEQQTLEHFRFHQFIRQTKKAYISYLSTANYQRIASLGPKTPTTWNAIRLACRRRNINMDMRLCRKIFASWLRQSGIQSEIVDLLQGRVSPSILTRHYLAPQDTLKDEVLRATEELQTKFIIN